MKKTSSINDHFHMYDDGKYGGRSVVGPHIERGIGVSDAGGQLVVVFDVPFDGTPVINCTLYSGNDVSTFSANVHISARSSNGFTAQARTLDYGGGVHTVIADYVGAHVNWVAREQ